MSVTSQPTTPPEAPRLSDEEIGETFEKLRLNDPRVREFYQQLATLEAAEPCFR